MSLSEMHDLLDGLPPETLPVAEQFLRFLQEQASRGKTLVNVPGAVLGPPYPTVRCPASVIDSLVNLMPALGGDALSESEALYDQG